MSAIKGGGRAQLSTAAEEEIVALLYDLRSKKNPLLPRFSLNKTTTTTNDESKEKLFQELSSHDQKKEQRRFLKRLLEAHDRSVLAKKCSGATSFESFTSSSSAVSEKDKTGKVRLEVVEAKSKSSKKSSSASSKSSWKFGSTRKTFVLNRNTAIAKDLLDSFKSKLRMKQRPTRLFYVDKFTNMEVDLVQDLSVLEDGSTVYATTYNPQSKSSKAAEDQLADTKEEMSSAMDPLKDVKEAYRRRARPSQRVHYPVIKYHHPKPLFSECMHMLESLSEARSKLPAASYRSTLLSSLDKSRVIIISGETGCGKSTQIPQYLLEGMKATQRLDHTNIIVTQPRKVAATSLAMRVCNERECPPPGKEGSVVGYNVRLAKAISESTKITYCTVGVLLRMLLNPVERDERDCPNDNESKKAPSAIPLSNVSHVVIDEVHERDLNTDFILTLLKPLLLQNKNLSVVLMSATASVSLFMNYFSGLTSDDGCTDLVPQALSIPGRTFPVDTYWLSDCERLVSEQMSCSLEERQDLEQQDSSDGDLYQMSPRATSQIDNDFIVKLILQIVKMDEDVNKICAAEDNQVKSNGAILVFLPGKGEIEKLAAALSKDSKLGDQRQCKIIPLHSMLTNTQQWSAFQPVKQGILKIVLATNIAETSITIPDISIVIDAGRVKESRFNTDTRIKELVTVWTSQASGKQRAGRAGRVTSGVCYKLYTEEFATAMMPRHTSPEIMRTPLDELVLQICYLKEQNVEADQEQERSDSTGVSPIEFLASAPESPPTKRILHACKHLVQIGAMTIESRDPTILFRLTPLGYHLSHLPMDVNIGKILIVGSVLRCSYSASIVAATLSTTKSCWLPYIYGEDNSKQKARKRQEAIVRDGFGGESWRGGTVKSDLCAVIAAYNAWMCSGDNDKQRRNFARQNALDHNVLLEIKGLQSQFKDALSSSGLMSYSNDTLLDFNDDALLTSCCLVAGLYPNIATLLRPNREMRIRGKRLITKDGDSCRPSSSSFQCDRVRNASEVGKDVYAIFHGKHRSIGASTDQASVQDTFLSGVSFVSRFTLLLFGGEINIQQNYIILDDWLKFKVGEKDSGTAGRVNVLLIQELRKEIDRLISYSLFKGDMYDAECRRVIGVVRKLLVEE